MLRGADHFGLFAQVLFVMQTELSSLNLNDMLTIFQDLNKFQ